MKIAFFVDDFGYIQLNKILKRKDISCIVVASNRNYYKKIVQLNSTKIPIFIQPKYSKKYLYRQFKCKLKSMKIDTIVCNSYSMKIDDDILTLAKNKAINIHWSYLPQNKGANALQWSIIKGEKFTGITMHKLSNIIDGGDILFQKKVMIKNDETWIKLKRRMTKISNHLLYTKLYNILSNKKKAKKQNSILETSNPRLTPTYPIIDWSCDDQTIYDLIRAQVYPLKGAYTIYNNDKIFFDRFVKKEDIKMLRNKYA